MGEEILSPTSDPSHTPPQHQREHESEMKEQKQGTTSHGKPRRQSIGQRRFSTPKTARAGVDKPRNDSPNRSKWPGLNVITDFSKGIDAVTTSTKPKPQIQRNSSQGVIEDARKAQTHDREPGSQTTPPGKADPRLAHQLSGKSLKSSDSKGRLGDLKRASSKMSNLSPSDRAVVIGISLSPDKMEARDESSSIKRSLGSGENDHPRRPSLTPSITPSIVVTPAKESAPWNEPGKEKISPPRPRAASSVYSQMTTAKDRVMNSSIVPPVPPVPPDLHRMGNSPHHNGNSDEKSHPRVTSTCTVFDEEPSPDAAASYSRPGSRDSQLHMLAKSTSIDTLATKHQSQGWWTILKSPFFPKSPMNLKFQHPNSTEDTPPIPTPTKASAHHRGGSKEDLHEERPPQYRRSQAAESAHTSWTDSSLEAECEKRALTFEESSIENGVKKAASLQIPRESLYRPATFEGLGAASEYFEACLYDMHSTTPYFECQNHACLPSTLEAGAHLSRDIEDPEPPPAVRGLALGEPTLGSEKYAPKETKSAGGLLAPSNRFSAAFREAVDPKGKERPVSEATVIEDLDATPDVREAKVAPVVKAPEPVSTSQTPSSRAPPSLDPSPMRPSPQINDHASPYFIDPEPKPKILPAPPPRLPEKDISPQEVIVDPGPENPDRHFVAGLPPNPRNRRHAEPMSPDPPTPEVLRRTSEGAIAMAEWQRSVCLAPAPQNTYITNHYHQSTDTTAQKQGRLFPPSRPARGSEVGDFGIQRWTSEKRVELPHRKQDQSQGLAKLKACLEGRKKRTQRPETHKDKKKRKILLISVGIALLLMIVIILVLVMTLTRRGDKMDIESQWLNVTGYPPIPTGVSTIARPDAVEEESGCVQPETMWSCALPKEEQEDIAPNAPNQPNFRVEMRFQNGTNVTMTNSSSASKRSMPSSGPISARSFIRNRLLHIRDTFTSALYTPSPEPPSREDQTFLGNTTDDNQAPYDGEFTPFFMTFQSAAPLPSRHRLKRDVLPTTSSTSDNSSSSSSDNSTSQFPDLAASIPAAETNPDGTASPALLHPYPSAQPLRLYDRGLPTEHYGFYTYFSRSIFLKSTAPLNASTITNNPSPPEPADTDGGATEREASVRCTWAQTRFLVQIWTNKGDGGKPYPLLSDGGAGNTSTPAITDKSTKSPKKSDKNTTSSATDLTRPGSFPYPISLSLDRHGGDPDKKSIYCYGLDNHMKPIPRAKKLQLEDRAFGGEVVNPAEGIFSGGDEGGKRMRMRMRMRKRVDDEGGNGNGNGMDGVDGGKGGCGCRWQNWR